MVTLHFINYYKATSFACTVTFKGKKILALVLYVNVWERKTNTYSSISLNADSGHAQTINKIGENIGGMLPTQF